MVFIYLRKLRSVQESVTGIYVIDNDFYTVCSACDVVKMIKKYIAISFQ